MAACPCGCGRRLGFGKNRIAGQGVELGVAFPLIERFAASVHPDIPDQLRADARRLLGEGHELRAVMLAIGHGEPMPTDLIPGPAEVNAWRGRANVVAWCLSRAEPGSVEAHASTLPSDQAKLVRSMVTAGARQSKRLG